MAILCPGLNDRSQESYWRWSDCTTGQVNLTQHWAPGFPSRNGVSKDCILLRADDKIIDTNCSELHAYICGIVFKSMYAIKDGKSTNKTRGTKEDEHKPNSRI